MKMFKALQLFIILLSCLSCSQYQGVTLLFCNVNNVDGSVIYDFAIDKDSVKTFNPNQIRKQLNSLFKLEALVTFHSGGQKYQFIRTYSYNPWDKFYCISDSANKSSINYDDYEEFVANFFVFKQFDLPNTFKNMPVLFNYELGSRNFPPIFEIFDKNICNIAINNIKLMP